METKGEEAAAFFCARKKKLTPPPPPPPPSRRSPPDTHGRGRWTNPREGNKKERQGQLRSSFGKSSSSQVASKRSSLPPKHAAPLPPPSHLPRNLMFCFLLLLHGWRIFSPAVQKNKWDALERDGLFFVSTEFTHIENNSLEKKGKNFNGNGCIVV